MFVLLGCAIVLFGGGVGGVTRVGSVEDSNGDRKDGSSRGSVVSGCGILRMVSSKRTSRLTRICLVAAL